MKDQNNNVKLTADRIGDIFYLRKSEESNFICGTKNTIYIWHTRLGHFNQRDIISMLKNNHATEFNFDLSTTFKDCTTCSDGKFTRTPFNPREKSSELQLVHTNVCGPMHNVSNGGVRYFITFSDGYSKWCQVHFIKQTSEAIEKFLGFKNMVENQTGLKIKSVQSDSGSEKHKTFEMERTINNTSEDGEPPFFGFERQIDSQTSGDDGSPFRKFEKPANQNNSNISEESFLGFERYSLNETAEAENQDHKSTSDEDEFYDSNLASSASEISLKDATNGTDRDELIDAISVISTLGNWLRS